MNDEAGEDQPAHRDQAPARIPALGAHGGEVKWERVAEILAAVNGVWAVRILRHLASGVSRPGDLLAAINAEAASHLFPKVMFDTLARLVDYGLISRTTVQGWPRETHYWLTHDGREILNEVAKLGASGGRWGPLMHDAPPPAVPGVDTTRPSPARVWNYAIGGKDYFQVDSEAAAAVLAVMPSLQVTARLTRRFQADAVRLLLDRGVRQFLDIGTGLPAAGALHEVAQRAAPESRVVYVDNDPQVAMHARALLVSSKEGACSFLHADVREPGKILAHAAETLDLSRPVAIFLLMVMHFIPDEDDPWGIVRRLTEGLRGDRYLVIAHAGTRPLDEAAQVAEDEYNARSPVAIRTRSHEEVTRFFIEAGATLVEPGLVPLPEWWPAEAGEFGDVPGYAGIGWRPATGL